MTDRALHVCIGLSLALHVLLIGQGLGAGRADAIAEPREPVPVRIRLRGPQTQRVETTSPTPPVVRESEPPAPVAKPVAKSDPKPPKPRPKPPEPPLAKREPPPEPSPAAPHVQEVARVEPETHAVAEPTTSALEEAVNAAPSVSAAPSEISRATGREDDEEDRLARYVEAIRSRIEGRKRYPPLARKRSVEGRVVARVAIGVDGRIRSVEYDRGAQPLLRRATEDAIRAAAPYPAPPDGALTIELPIDYSLRDAS